MEPMGSVHVRRFEGIQAQARSRSGAEDLTPRSMHRKPNKNL